MTPMAPSTRTSRTPGRSRAGASPSCRPRSTRATPPRQSPPVSRPTLAAATAHASGLPMNVGPWASTGTSPSEMPRATSGVHRAAASVR